MEIDRNEAFAGATSLPVTRAMQTESCESLLADAGWWLTGGASLLLWSVMAWVLTGS
jgi:hypothetical protein